jgi:hypothetical protein
MATLTQPTWDPSPVPALPALTTVTFTVRPRRSGVQVRYRLFGGARIRYRPTPAGKLIRTDERAASTPALTPVERNDGLTIIDHYPSTNRETEIVRGIAIEQLGPDKPGIATLSVTVWDLDDDGNPKNMSTKEVTTSFL